jgi:hypothetical protein
LIGLGGAAALPAPRPQLFSAVAIGTLSLGGVLLAIMAFVDSTFAAVALAFFIGISLGFSNLLTITWIQRRIPGTLMGRVMSVLMLGSLGLVPISTLIAGIVVTVNLSALLVVGGVGMALICLASLLTRPIRNMGFEPVITAEEPPQDSTSLPAAA